MDGKSHRTTSTMPEIVAPLDRARTPVEDVLVEAVRDHDSYKSVAVIGRDHNDDPAYTSSGMTHEEFVYLLLDVIDAIRRAT